jgi:hypothetical protein
MKKILVAFMLFLDAFTSAQVPMAQRRMVTIAFNR